MHLRSFALFPLVFLLELAGRAAAEPLTLVGPFYDGSAPDFTFTSLAENGGVATYTATSTGTDGAETYTLVAGPSTLAAINVFSGTSGVAEFRLACTWDPGAPLTSSAVESESRTATGIPGTCTNQQSFSGGVESSVVTTLLVTSSLEVDHAPTAALVAASSVSASTATSVAPASASSAASRPSVSVPAPSSSASLPPPSGTGVRLSTPGALAFGSFFALLLLF